MEQLLLNYISLCDSLVKNDNKTHTNTPELELRFGNEVIPHTNYKKFVSHTNFDNVVRWLLGIGFKSSNQASYSLRIFPDSQPNIRVEINGFEQIRKYCENENLSDFIASFQGGKQTKSIKLMHS